MPVFAKNSRVLFSAKLGVSLGLIAYLVSVVDWERAIQTINEADKVLIAVSPLFWFASLIVASVRWRLALADSGVRFSLWQAYSGYLIGALYDLFLPGVVGGDIVRTGQCASQTGCKLGTAAASVLSERISGVFALLSFLLGVFFLSPATSAALATVESTLPLVLLVTTAMIVMAIILLGNRMWVRSFLGENAKGMWAFVHSGMQALGTLRGRTLGTIVILSALFQAMRIVGMFVLSRGIGLVVPLNVFFAVIPLVYLATLLPVSLGGLGVREGTLAFLLAQFGVATSDAVTLAFLIYLNQVLVAALGGLVQMARSISDKKTRVKRANTIGLSDH